jgi:hypothetical protein
MSDPAIMDDEVRSNRVPAAAQEVTVSRALSGPLAALGALRYELGRDEVWVIGRLPDIVPGHSS